MMVMLMVLFGMSAVFVGYLLTYTIWDTIASAMIVRLKDDKGALSFFHGSSDEDDEKPEPTFEPMSPITITNEIEPEPESDITENLIVHTDTKIPIHSYHSKDPVGYVEEMPKELIEKNNKFFNVGKSAKNAESYARKAAEKFESIESHQFVNSAGEIEQITIPGQAARYIEQAQQAPLPSMLNYQPGQYRDGGYGEQLVNAVQGLVAERQDADLRTEAAERELFQAKEAIDSLTNELLRVREAFEQMQRQMDSHINLVDGIVSRAGTASYRLSNIPAPVVPMEMEEEVSEVTKNLEDALDNAPQEEPDNPDEPF